jgi:hypothetical protein
MRKNYLSGMGHEENCGHFGVDTEAGKVSQILNKFEMVPARMKRNEIRIKAKNLNS